LDIFRLLQRIYESIVLFRYTVNNTDFTSLNVQIMAAINFPAAVIYRLCDGQGIFSKDEWRIWLMIYPALYLCLLKVFVHRDKLR
jgi:hypothetical protein